MRKLVVSFVAMAVLGSPPLAGATEQHWPGRPSTPLAFQKLSETDAAARPAAGFKSQDPKASAFVVGWNFRICYQSRTLISGPYHVVYALNTDGSGFYAASVAENATQHQLWAACQHGAAGYWIHVTNTTGLVYSDLAIYYP